MAPRTVSSVETGIPMDPYSVDDGPLWRSVDEEKAGRPRFASDDAAMPSPDGELAEAPTDPGDVALLAGLVDSALASAQGDDALAGEPIRPGGRHLSDEELSGRLHRSVLPALRARSAYLGYLSVGHIARAVIDLQRSQPHLADVRALVVALDVPVLAGGADRSPRTNPPWAVEAARRLVRGLIHARPDEALVIRRLRYDDVSPSAATRAFLVEAWLGHTLSRAEERELATVMAAEVARVGADVSRWSAEASRARESLVLDNLWLCARTARLHVGRGMEIDDLLQVAVEGLFRAVVRFDPDRGTRFVSYAGHWVFQSVSRALGDSSRLIRLPVHLHQHGRRVEAARDALWAALRREPTHPEIATSAGVPESAVVALLVTSRPVSLDDPRHAEPSRNLLSADEPMEETIEQADLRRTINDLLADLTERERTVVERRFGLGGGEQETLDAIGQDLGVTRERIRQLEEKALAKLRHPARVSRLHGYADVESARVDDVTPAQASAVVDALDHGQRPIAVALWGLGGARPQTVKAVTRRFGIPTTHVAAVVSQVVELAREVAAAEASEHAARISATSAAAPRWWAAFPVAKGNVRPGRLGPRPEHAEPTRGRRPDDRVDRRFAAAGGLTAPRPPSAPPRSLDRSVPSLPRIDRGGLARPEPPSGEPAPPTSVDAADVARLRPMLLPRSWEIAAALWGADGNLPQPVEVVAERFGVRPGFVRTVAAGVLRLASPPAASTPSPGPTGDHRPTPPLAPAVPAMVTRGTAASPSRLVDALDPAGWAAVIAAVERIDPADREIVASRIGVGGSAPLNRRAAARRVRRPETWVYILERVLRGIGEPTVAAVVQRYWDELERG